MSAWSSLARILVRRSTPWAALRALSTVQDVNAVKSPYKEVTVPNVHLADFAWEMVEKIPEKTALVRNINTFHNLQRGNIN